MFVSVCVAMEENLCRDNHRDQPSDGELEIPSRWSCFSGDQPYELINKVKIF